MELLAEQPERFGTVLHAYVAMPNHFHLVLETPEANLSRTGQWLDVSYSVWFNRLRAKVRGNLMRIGGGTRRCGWALPLKNLPELVHSPPMLALSSNRSSSTQRFVPVHTN